MLSLISGLAGRNIPFTNSTDVPTWTDLILKKFSHSSFLSFNFTFSGQAQPELGAYAGNIYMRMRDLIIISYKLTTNMSVTY